MDWRPISADSHITEPPNCYVDHIDPAFRERAPRVVHRDGIGDTFIVDGMKTPVPLGLIAAAGIAPKDIRIGGAKFDDLHRSGWDPSGRLADQDKDGVAAEIIYPTVGMLICNHPDFDYKKACFDAYNRWLQGYCSHDPNRLIGMGQTAIRYRQGGHRGPRAHQGDGLQGRHDAGQPGRKGLRRSGLRPAVGSGGRARPAAQLAHPHLVAATIRCPSHAGPSSTASSASSAAARTSWACWCSRACSSGIPSCAWSASRPMPAGRRISCTAWTTPTSGIATG